MKQESSVAQSTRQGFTIVELVITVVIIGIITAITIVAYNGVARRAVEVSMRSDLENARTAIALLKAGNKVYPSDASAANNGQGLKASGNNQLVYGASGANYCVAAKNPATPTVFRLITGQIEEASCGHIVTTFVGSSSYFDVTDGLGSAGTFGWPASMDIDTNGTLFVGDCGSALRTVSPLGLVSTLAGSNTSYDYVDSPIGANARFGCVMGVKVHSSGDIYVSDSVWNEFYGIRKVSPSGAVTTIAGSTRGSTEGPAATAQFYTPYGLTFDTAGNLYVADAGNNDRIRMITPGGTVSTFAGSTGGFNDANGAAAQFSDPHGITIDSSGNLYVADSGNRRIRKITPSGDVTTFAGSGVDASVDGVGEAAAFGYPTGITIDANNNLYVTDNSPYAIRKITPDRVVTTIAGDGNYGFADKVGIYSQFGWMENGISIDSAGVVYVVDSDNYLIRKLVE